MENQKGTPQQLSPKEQIELNQLKRKLFGDDKFVVFDIGTLMSEDYKRYDELLRKKMAYLNYIDRLVRCN